MPYDLSNAGPDHDLVAIALIELSVEKRVQLGRLRSALRTTFAGRSARRRGRRIAGHRGGHRTNDLRLVWKLGLFEVKAEIFV